MDMDYLHRLANTYDAAWEMVKEGTSGGVSDETRSRFRRAWGETVTEGVSDDDLVAWARNFLRHNARPNV
jgi:hypothetical protein